MSTNSKKFVSIYGEWMVLGKPSKKKTAYFVTLDQKVGGYLFQNIISFEEEIVTYIKGGWVSNTDVTISYIHILFFFLHISTFMEKRGQWKWNFFCWTPPLDFMEIELDNTEDKLCFNTKLLLLSTSSKCVCASNVIRFYAQC